jgi:pyruvate,water dikinase
VIASSRARGRRAAVPEGGPTVTKTTTATDNAAAEHGATEAIRAAAELTRHDVAFAGGKGANLGELTHAGFPVPDAIVVGAPAYAAFRDAAGLRGRLSQLLESLDVDDTTALEQAAAAARGAVLEAPIPGDLDRTIRDRVAGLTENGRLPVAVRSSATAEDTESASFAGMNETFLNVVGIDATITAIRGCWASLFGARSIFYRAKRGFGQADMDIAVVVQRQVAATRAGVMFTIDPGARDTGTLVIEASLGLGETVVSGAVSPDRYVVRKADLALVVREVRRKAVAIEPGAAGGTDRRDVGADEASRPALTDEEIREVAKLGIAVEKHYGSPQDTEWAFDADGRLWILQARPITTPARPSPTSPAADAGGTPLLHGLGASPGRASGPVRIISDLHESARLRDGEVLVAAMTAPDWVPLMRRAAAIVTDSGGMTCHAAIVSRELGIPCVVGTGDATRRLRDGEVVTVDGGRGTVVAGRRLEPGTPPPLVAPAAPRATATRILVNLSEPSQLERARALSVDGVGLLRAELMLLEALGGVHPRALLEDGRGAEVVSRMADAVRAFATAFAPRPVTYRTIDFRTNEFRGLRGGERFEPVEANPMIGLRGALRYTREPEVLGLELEALGRVWDAGFENVHVMLPFVRTVRELDRCIELVDASGLSRRRGFELWVMAEVPSVLFNLERYARRGIAGISIGSNDLTQLLLGADRDSEAVAEAFDERDHAVTEYLAALIASARSQGLKTSICGQAPSVHPEYAELLVRAGIDAISVTPDAVDRTRRLVAAAEQRIVLDAARTARSS